MSNNDKAMTLSEVTRIFNSDAWQSVIEENWSGYGEQRLSCSSYKTLLRTCFDTYVSNVRRYIEKTAVIRDSAITHQETLRQSLFEATLTDFNEYLGKMNSRENNTGTDAPNIPVSSGRHFILDVVFRDCADTMMEEEVPVGLVNPGDTLGDVIEALLIHMVMSDTLKAAPPEYLLEEFESLKQQYLRSGEALSGI